MSIDRRLIQKLCINIVFWLDDKEFVSDSQKQIEAIRSFMGKHLSELRRSLCLWTDLGRLVMPAHVQEWHELYKCAERSETGLVPVILSAAIASVSKETYDTFIRAISARMERSNFSDSSNLSETDIMRVIGSLFGHGDITPRSFVPLNDSLNVSMEHGRRLSLSEQILNISGGGGMLDSPNRRAPCSRCTDLEQKLHIKNQCLRDAERYNEELMQFREKADELNANLQERNEKQARQLAKIADYESLQKDNTRLCQENRRLQEDTAKLTKLMTENEVLRLRISRLVDKVDNEVVEKSKLEATIHERNEDLNCRDSAFSALETQMEELKEAYYQLQNENVTLKQMLEESSAISQRQNTSEMEQRSFEIPSFSGSLPLQQHANEEESIQLQFLKKDLQEKEEELNGLQQRFSECSKKLAALESVDLISKQKDELLHNLEQQKKQLQQRVSTLVSEADEQQQRLSEASLEYTRSINAVRAELSAEKAESNDRLSQLRIVEAELKTAETNVAILSEEKSALIESLDLQKQDNVSLPGLENMDESWKDKIAAKEASFDELQETLQTAKESLEVKLDECDENEKTIHRLTAEVEGLEEDRDREREQRKTITQEAEKYKEELEKSCAREEALKKECNLAEEMIKALEEKMTEMSSNEEQQNQSLQSAKKELVEELETRKKNEAALKEKTIELETANSKLVLLKDEHEKIVAQRVEEAESTKELLEKDLQEKQDGINALQQRISEYSEKIAVFEERESAWAVEKCAFEAKIEQKEKEIVAIQNQFRRVREDMTTKLREKDETIKAREKELVEEESNRNIVTEKYNALKTRVRESENALQSWKKSEDQIKALGRDLALKNRELVEKADELQRSNEKNEKLIRDKQLLNKNKEESSARINELEAALKSSEKKESMSNEKIKQLEKTINDLQKYQQQTEVEEDSDEFNASLQFDRSKLPLPKESILSEAALLRHNAENQPFSTPIQTPGGGFTALHDCEDEDDDDHVRQALFRTSHITNVLAKDEDKGSSSTHNQTSSDPASSSSAKSSPAEKENEFHYKSRGDFISQRNKLQPAHLRSSYPVEQESTPSKNASLKRQEAFKKPKTKRRSSVKELGVSIRKRFRRSEKND